MHVVIFFPFSLSVYEPDGNHRPAERRNGPFEQVSLKPLSAHELRMMSRESDESNVSIGSFTHAAIRRLCEFTMICLSVCAAWVGGYRLLHTQRMIIVNSQMNYLLLKIQLNGNKNVGAIRSSIFIFSYLEAQVEADTLRHTYTYFKFNALSKINALYGYYSQRSLLVHAVH